MGEGLHPSRAAGRWCDPEMEDRQDACPASERAFTMVEVAISLAIIGFALVAIIGILPAGLNVQKENREETIINQEASIWMDVIRQGAEGLDYLTNYVDLIEVTVAEYDADGNFYQFVSPDPVPFQFAPDHVNPDFRLTNGAVIMSVLSTPKYYPVPGGGGNYFSNHVVAYVRSVSGGATDKAPQDNQTVRASAFSYRLTSEVIPFYAHDDRWFDYTDFRGVVAGGGGDPSLAYARNLAGNLHDVRLRFEWPLRPPVDPAWNVATNTGNGGQTFRSLVGGTMENLSDPSLPPAFWRIHPGEFAKARGGGS